MVLEKELRLYILMCRLQKETVCHTVSNLSIWNLKTGPHSDTLPPTMPQLLWHSLTANMAIPYRSGIWIHWLVCGGHSYSNNHTHQIWIGESFVGPRLKRKEIREIRSKGIVESQNFKRINEVVSISAISEF